MAEFILFLHVFSAIGLGFYLLLPFLAMKLGSLTPAGQEGLASGVFRGNRIAQYVLVVQFLTGGYLVSQEDYSTAWIVVVVILFVGSAALAGIMSKPLENLIGMAKAGQSSEADIDKVKNFSTIVAVLLVVIIILMSYPTLI